MLQTSLCDDGKATIEKASSPRLSIHTQMYQICYRTMHKEITQAYTAANMSHIVTCHINLFRNNMSIINEKMEIIICITKHIITESELIPRSLKTKVKK